MAISHQKKQALEKLKLELKDQKRRSYETKRGQRESLLQYFSQISSGEEDTTTWLDYGHDIHALPPGVLEEAIRRNTRNGAEHETMKSTEYAPDDINEWDEDTLYLVTIGRLELPRSWFSER